MKAHPGPRIAALAASAANDVPIGETSGPSEQLAQNQENELHRQSQARLLCLEQLATKARMQFAILSPTKKLVESAVTGVQKTSCVLMPLA